MTLHSGLLLGPYEIIALVGGPPGGMGEVYRAKDSRLGREVAVKVPPERWARDPDALGRFRREARALAALTHPNILDIHDLGEDSGIIFIVTELLEGETLGERIRAGPIPWRNALEIGLSIAEGLAAAHGCGVIHRDLKPDNIFLVADGRVKILDFGLARREEVIAQAPEGEAEIPFSTKSDILVGTAGYIAPEQVKRKPADEKSDIFAFGCILYEMVTGCQAFSADTPEETLVATLKEEPKDPADLAEIPEDVRMIILRCLAKKPQARFQSVRDLAFALQVAKSAVHPDPPPSPGPPRPRLPWLLAAAAAMIVAALAVLFTSFGGGTVDSLAVLPFTNASGDPNAEYVSDGLTDRLIGDLSQLPNLRVLAWTTVMQARGKAPIQAGRDLDVRAVVTGRVLRRGDRLVGQAELVDVRKGTRLWGRQFDRSASDAFAVDEIAREMSQSLRARIAGKQESLPIHRPPRNAEAYDFYLKGRYQWNKRTIDGISKSIGFFQQSVALDPNYAPAYAGLAGAFDLLGFYGIRSGVEVLPLARDAALRAIALDESIAEAHTSLAHVLYQFEWDFPAAEKEFRRAIALSPNEPNAHQWYSNFLSVSRRNEEAFEQIRLARKLDPLNLITYADAGLAHYLAGQYDRAIEELRQSLELEGNFYLAHIDLALALGAKGLFEQSMAEARTAMSLQPYDPNPIALLGYACARAGRVKEAEQALGGLQALGQKRFVSAFPSAFVNAGLGRKDKTLELLEKAYEERAGMLVYLNIVHAFEPFRSEPRLQALSRKMKLPA